MSHLTHPSGIRQEIVDKVVARRGRLYAFPTLNPAKTALVIIDLDMGTGRDAENFEQIITNINRLTAALRKRSGTIAWVTTPIQEPTENFCAVFGEAFTAKHEEMGKLGGESSTIWPELHVGQADIRATKTGHSAFFPGKCDLHEQLAAKGIETLLIVGAVTNVCCEASARDAAELQYKVTLVSDALIGHSFGLHEATLATFFRCYGDVRPSDEAVKLIVGLAAV